MLKRTITFEDFDGNSRSEDYYFNLSKSELVELETSYDSGLEKHIQRIVAAEDMRALVTEFKKLILLSYGEKSEDGKRFVKSEELRTAFTQTPAYDALFMELATDADAAATFVEGILPKGMPNVQDQDKPLAPPPPPVYN